MVIVRKIIYLILFVFSLFFSKYSFSELVVVDPTAIGYLVNQLEQLKQQAQDLKKQISSLNYFNWNDDGVDNMLKEFNAYLKQSDQMTIDVNKVAQQFKDNYNGYVVSDNYQKQLKSVIENTESTLQSVMKMMAKINGDEDNVDQNKKLKKIQNQIENAKGTTEALQGLGQIMAQIASHLQILDKTIAAQSTAQDAYYAQTVQMQASVEAKLNQVIQEGSKEVPRYGGSGDYLKIPDF